MMNTRIIQIYGKSMSNGIEASHILPRSKMIHNNVTESMHQQGRRSNEDEYTIYSNLQ